MNKTFPPIGIYEKAIVPQSWERMFSDAASAGYQNFELSLDESDRRIARLDWTKAETAAVSAAADAAGIKLFSMCLSAHRRFPMGSADAAVRDRSLQIFQSAIRLCGELGIRVIQVAGYDVFYEPHTPDTEKRYADGLAYAVHWAEQAGVMLAIEPVEVFLVSISKAMSLVRTIDSPWLQVYPDIANMAGLGIDPVPELPLGKGHTVAVHVREAQPDYFLNVLPFGSGIVDFDACFRQLCGMGFMGPFTVEMWNQTDPNYFEIIKDARVFVEERIRAAYGAASNV